MNKLVGIKGLIGSGKSTVSKILTYNYNMVEYSIAEPLKEFAKSIGFEHHQVYGTQEEKLEINKKWGISGRKFMQKFGTDVVRDGIHNAIPEMKLNGKTLWIRAFELNVLNKSENIVVSDVRFKDEANTIREYGGWIIEIVDEKFRDNIENKEKSELSMKDIEPHIVIYNTGTLEELEDMVDRCMRIVNKNDPASKYFAEGGCFYIYPMRYKYTCHQRIIKTIRKWAKSLIY